MTSSKHDFANYDQFVPNFDMANETIQRVSVSNLKLFGTVKTELWTKEIGGFSIILYWKMGWSHLIPTSDPCAMFTHFLVEHGLSQHYLY